MRSVLALLHTLVLDPAVRAVKHVGETLPDLHVAPPLAIVKETVPRLGRLSSGLAAGDY